MKAATRYFSYTNGGVYNFFLRKILKHDSKLLNIPKKKEKMSIIPIKTLQFKIFPYLKLKFEYLPIKRLIVSIHGGGPNFPFEYFSISSLKPACCYRQYI
jgi:hypothetical protein